MSANDETDHNGDVISLTLNLGKKLYNSFENKIIKGVISLSLSHGRNV